MYKYIRKVQYYETDKMGITHHSNYIKWMEEARTAFLDSIGLPFKAIEEKGIVSPVTAVNVEYKKTSTYDDEINVEVSISKFNGVKLDVRYIMANATNGQTVAEAYSSHCFIKNGKICSLKREEPQMYQRLCAATENA